MPYYTFQCTVLNTREALGQCMNFQYKHHFGQIICDRLAHPYSMALQDILLQHLRLIRINQCRTKWTKPRIDTINHLPTFDNLVYIGCTPIDSCLHFY
ncbi:hypothetical protein D3C73_765710 [compost metagenome]